MISTNTALPESLNLHRVLTSAQAAEFCGYRSAEHWRELHRQGRTPAAIKLSCRRYGWRVSDLIGWLDQRKSFQEAA